MVAILLFVIFIWSLYAFIVDGIIAPTFQDHIRNRIYGTRDILRRMRLQKPDHIGDAVFQLAESSANDAIQLVPSVTFGMLIRAQKATQRNTEIKSAVKRDCELLAETDFLVSKAIIHLYYRVVQAAVINSSNWAIIVIPLFLMIKTVKQLPRLQWFFDQAHVLLQIQNRKNNSRNLATYHHQWPSHALSNK